MSDQKKLDSDTYEALHSDFHLFDDTPPEESDVKNSGEIYFSANSNGFSASSRQSTYQGTKQVNTKAQDVKFSSVKPTKTAQAKTVSATKKSGKKKKKKQSTALSLILTLSIIVGVLAASFLIRIPVMGCVNDILAIDRSSTQKRIVITEDMDTDDVIDLLAQKNLIHSAVFCKLATRFLGYYKNDPYYPPGSYDISADMGVEEMLRQIRIAGKETSTVTLSFPEGFTVDQIIERLSGNGVASKNALIQAFSDDSLLEEYEFLSGITNKENRYHWLEGYLYPDTYEFYIGEDPNSVVRRFLNNFQAKWEESFAASLENSKYTMDEILTVASILEKEAKDAEQMPIIASIIYNRLSSSSFPFINCDSTAKYITNNQEELEKAGTYSQYLYYYDTYQQNGLPIGPICNPGADAIEAALSPDSTDYYYFLHDKDGKIYLASTVEQHKANQAYMENSSQSN